MESQLYDGKHNIISERVKIARGRKGISQEALADRLQTEDIHIDHNGIHKIESNRRKVYDYELRYIAKHLGVTVDWLLGDEPL